MSEESARRLRDIEASQPAGGSPVGPFADPYAGSPFGARAGAGGPFGGRPVGSPFDDPTDEPAPISEPSKRKVSVAVWIVVLVAVVGVGVSAVWLVRSPPATTLSPSTPSAAPSSLSTAPPGVAELLTRIHVVRALPNVPGYERSCSPGDGCVFGPAWTDVERTGCDTRNRVLAAQMTDVVFKPGTRNCKVVSGILHDPYSGATLVFDSATRADIEIDHVFALAAAWDAGAAQWPYERRVAFANDTANLLAVSGEENQHKSDSGPGSWLPPNQEFTCRYIERYLSVAAKYRLMITEQDKAVAQGACAG